MRQKNTADSRQHRESGAKVVRFTSWCGATKRGRSAAAYTVGPSMPRVLQHQPVVPATSRRSAAA